MRKTQVGANYFSMPYLSRERWISFWYQMMEVMESLREKDQILPRTKGSDPKSMLEIGPGPGIVAELIGKMNVLVTTVDIDFQLKPNVCADVTKLPFKSRSFDSVLAAEILEHLPFDKFEGAVEELTRVAKKTVVITLPRFSNFAPSIALKLFPFVPRWQKVWPITWPVKHNYDGQPCTTKCTGFRIDRAQHHWEIGKRGFSLKKVKKILSKNKKFGLVKDYLIEENPYHHVFVLNRE